MNTIHTNPNAARIEIRELQLSLAQSPPLNFADRTATQKRIAFLEANMHDLTTRWKSGIAAENQTVLQQAESDLEKMREHIERAYATLNGSASGRAIAEAHEVLAKRESLMLTIVQARTAVIDNDPNISLGGFHTDHPARIRARSSAE